MNIILLVSNTWDELIKISKYVIFQEKANFNTDIIAYNELYSGKIII